VRVVAPTAQARKQVEEKNRRRTRAPSGRHNTHFQVPYPRRSLRLLTARMAWSTAYPLWRWGRR
jgi:hypothetical protein